MTFAMRGNTAEQVHGAYSRAPLQFKGMFYAQGRQPVGPEDGAPKWVAEFFRANPDVKQIAISREKSGVVYTRIDL